MDEEFDDQMDTLAIEAGESWERLQCAIWGPRWDYSRASLDFSRGSLRTLARWLLMADIDCDPKDLLADAAQYFGETVREHSLADWVRCGDGTVGLRVSCVDGTPRSIALKDVVTAWLGAASDEDPEIEEVFVRCFDRAVAGTVRRGSGRPARPSAS